VRDACSQVAVINEGKLVELGSVNDIFLNPKSPVTKDFISHIGTDRKPSDGSNIVRWSQEGGEYELSFPSEKQGAPVLSNVAKKFDVEFNIRAAGVQHLTDGDIGKMIVDFSGFQVSEALEYLRNQNIIVEKAGV
jgi:D-methionine transport system ATP-binding protein